MNCAYCEAKLPEENERMEYKCTECGEVQYVCECGELVIKSMVDHYAPGCWGHSL